MEKLNIELLKLGLEDTELKEVLKDFDEEAIDNVIEDINQNYSDYVYVNLNTIDTMKVLIEELYENKQNMYGNRYLTGLDEESIENISSLINEYQMFDNKLGKDLKEILNKETTFENKFIELNKYVTINANEITTTLQNDWKEQYIDSVKDFVIEEENRLEEERDNEISL